MNDVLVDEAHEENNPGWGYNRYNDDSKKLPIGDQLNLAQSQILSNLVFEGPNSTATCAYFSSSCPKS